jgi:serpin B
MLLNDPISKAGISRIFTGGLKNISDENLFVAKIKQKTFIQVNERGTEAGAATVIILDGSGGNDPQPVRFIANRPFLYLIKEKSTGAILFIGRMDNPAYQ